MKSIKYFVMDVDGTLTDGKIYMGISGELCKVFNVKDGYGIHNIIIPEGLIPVIITGRSSEILLKRCQELGIIEIHQGIDNKLEKLKEIAEDLSTVAYIGDDINDLSSMLMVKEAGGLVGAPKDAVNKVLDLADYIAEHNGGNGAVRDFIDWIIGD